MEVMAWQLQVLAYHPTRECPERQTHGTAVVEAVMWHLERYPKASGCDSMNPEGEYINTYVHVYVVYVYVCDCMCIC